MVNFNAIADPATVRAATDLCELVAQYVELRPKGREHIGLCPFHDDHAPSLTVVTHKGSPFYKCHACGAGGDAFNFVRDYHKISFAEALRFLANRAGLGAAVGPHGRCKLARRTLRVVFRKPERQRDYGSLAVSFHRDLRSGRLGVPSLEAFAQSLGVSSDSLDRLGVGWCVECQAYSFPMTNADGSVLGIRLRTLSGRKFCIPGSTIGLFIPRNLQPTDDPLICEGESDTAAMLDLGFSVVGRPGCSHGTALLVELVKLNKPSSVTIVADAGEHGQHGAAALASTLAAQVSTVKVISPPPGIGDAREWKMRGATRHDILTAIKAAPSVTLRITTMVRGRERRRHRPLATA